MLKVGVAVVTVLAGAVGGAYLLGVVGAPSVVGVENRFGEVTEERSVVESDLTIHNPNPVGVSLGGVTVTHAVSMNGLPMASGTREGIEVGTGNTTLSFTTAMNNSKIPAWWVSHVRGGEHTDLRVNADVHSSLVGRTVAAPGVTRDVDTNVVGGFRSDERRPVNASSPLVTDPVAYVERTDAEWGAVDEETTEVEMTLYVHNPKSYPLVLSEVGYDVSMNGIAVGDGSAARTTTVPPGETVPVEATTAIRTQRLDEWWMSHLRANQTTEVRTRFSLVVDLSAAGGGERRVPLDAFERTVETDLFGNEASAGGESAGTADGANESDRTTATPDDGGDATRTTTGTSTTGPSGSDRTATDTATTTGTPGGTTTDDGLLAVARPGAR